MPIFVTDCPRCGSKQMTMDVTAAVHRFERHNWQQWYEIFCVCRTCHRPSIMLIAQQDIKSKVATSAAAMLSFNGSLNDDFRIDGPITLKDNFRHEPPEFLPDDVLRAYTEATQCLAIGCYNAAATMFRLCLDLVTRPLLPDPADTSRPQPSGKHRRDLGLRLEWLFENSLLPSALKELSACVREDSNDAAHRGNLEKSDAEDLLDFCNVLLDRLITEPAKLQRAAERRASRRGP